MNSRVYKWRRCCRVKLSEDLQETLLGAVANNTAGIELPPKHPEQYSESEGLSGDAPPAPARKRHLDTTTESDPAPAKRARLTRADTQRPAVQDERAEPADEAALQQPKPNPPKRPYASFLKDFVDPIRPDPGPASVHTFVSEWLESVGSGEKYCRSVSHLYHSGGDPIRHLTRSAPEMGHTRDADGFAVPPTPASTGSRSRRPSTADNHSQFSATGASGSSSPSSGVRHRMYRQNNLALNDIYIRPSAAPLPDVVASRMEALRADRDSPGLSAGEMDRVVDQLDALAEGCDEDDVAVFLNDTIFPNPKTDPAYGPSTGLMSSSSALMSQHLVPTNPISPYKVTQPKPDKLYGYSGNPNAAFTQPQLLAQTTIHPQIPHYPAATSQGLRFPFFAIEFKAAGGTRGDLWVATNQCAGASSACLNAVHQLNTSLPKHPSVQHIDNLSYCVAVDNNTAQLYISWKEDGLNYYLQRVDAFLLSSPEHFKDFRKKVRNILDWGKDKRLKQIKDALDIILEESRKKAAEQAKTRQPPSDDSGSSASKRRKPSRRNSGRQTHDKGPSQPYRASYGTASQGIYPDAGQQDQSQELASLHSAAEPTSFTTTGFTSSFDNNDHEDSYITQSSLTPHQQEPFETNDYVPQDIDDGLARCHYPEDSQQDQGQALVSFDDVAESQASFVDPLTEEQPTADDY
ncbi:hypothetical protein BU26DRAFT_482673 [Trematosphaeria pertusa]|uniref:DUF7924 domain-containing protein n=1 Tax=Trematosphaeria pertusa TaxID=390896 RepID=A0A6A6IHJ7_9PLEO|nr:uncharacterized protein BU26DRAFT_482673 [Trematosphaeria pertusa]KAF2249901.1 hypothetical protein BU26DRAFT_482673 [Trematosphaeria pertusa]